MYKKACPLCGKNDTIKAIYFGLPVRLCNDKNCSCMFGLFSEITQYLPFNGWMMSYTGSYFIALCHWLIGDFEE